MRAVQRLFYHLCQPATEADKRALLTPVLPALTRAEAGAKGGRGKKAGNDVNSFKGNSAAYLVARLKRDHPGIAEALARGEFPSARAAAGGKLMP
jgi:hypothetical protein